MLATGEVRKLSNAVVKDSSWRHRAVTAAAWRVGFFTQRDPIGLGGGVNQYGFAGGDPVNNFDPFGLIIQVVGSSAFKEKVQQLYDSDADFRADYDQLHNDTTAVFVILEDKAVDDARTYGGLRPTQDGDYDDTPFVVEQTAERGVTGNVRGFSRIGTHSGQANTQCKVAHEIIHLKGLANGGERQNLGHGHADFSRPYFTANGCAQAP